MTDTIISSATKEVVIGFGRPFVMIGERINPTGRKMLAAEMKEGNFSRVEADALAQVAACAHMLMSMRVFRLQTSQHFWRVQLNWFNRSLMCLCRLTRQLLKRLKLALRFIRASHLSTRSPEKMQTLSGYFHLLQNTERL